MKKYRLLLQSLFALMLCIGAGHASPYLYIGDDQGNLGTVDVTTGSVHVIRNMGHIMTDIAFDPVGNLYGITFTDLYSIDKNTGISTWIGSLGINDANALVFASDGTLYTARFTGTKLYTVNKSTGHANSIGTIGSGFISSGDIAFNGGNLYLAALGDQLVKIDLTNPRNSRSIGNMGAHDVYGLTTGNDGILYGATTTSKIVSFNTSTGAGSFILDYSGHGLSGAWGAATLNIATESESWPNLTKPLDISFEPIQPSLHLTALALGKSANEGGALFLDAPINIGIEVSFEGYVTQVSNSPFYTGYRYRWFKDGVKVSEEATDRKAQLTQSLLPRDKPYNVVLKAEKFDDTATAQSTPPVYNPNPVKPTINASIQVSIKPHPEWDCKGRLGAGCSDMSIVNKNLTTKYTVVPCDYPKKQKICIKSSMSGGAIKHDRCCGEDHPRGQWCDGFKSAQPIPLVTSDCEKEFHQAENDKLGGFFFEHTWIYPPEKTEDPASKGIKKEWWKKIAPPGTVISYEEKEPDQIDQAICQSEKAESLKTLIEVQNPVGGYANSSPITTIWVCSGNKPKPGEKIDWPTLVTPQGKINTVGNKIVPAVKSKAKKDTPAGCNKDPNVLSPSTGSAEEALKKYDTGANGCAE